MSIPFEFVIEELESAAPIIGRMFGCFSIYVNGKIVLILRDRPTFPEDNGVWIATTMEHHESLKEDLPSIKSISVFGPGPTGWQIIPVESDTFERECLSVCQMNLASDERIGKTPKPRKPPAKKKSSKKSAKKYPSKKIESKPELAGRTGKKKNFRH